MDEDLVVQAMRCVFSVRQAFSEQAFYTGDLPARQEVETLTGKIYVGGFHGSAFCFHEDGLLITCEHVRQDTHKPSAGHNPAFVVVCPYEGGGAELDWQHSWRAEFVAHTGNPDPAYQSLVLEEPPLPPGMILPDKIDLAILRLVAPLAATPLAKPPPPLRLGRNDPEPMQECWVLGYPPAGGATPTPVPVSFSFTDGSFTGGNVLKLTGAQVMPGHSGGPLVTKSGTVVGWNFGRNKELSWSWPIAAAEKCIGLVLTAPNAWEQLLASPEAESAHDRQEQQAVNARTAAGFRRAAELLEGDNTRPNVASSSHRPTESPKQEPRTAAGFRRAAELLEGGSKRLKVDSSSHSPMESLSAQELGEQGDQKRQQYGTTAALDMRTAAGEALKWAAGLNGIDVDTLQTWNMLRFSGINLTMHIDKLVSLMSTLTKLEGLDLSGCNLGANGAQITKLSDALSSSRLVTLNLSDNKYTQEEAVPLIESLPSTITGLGLDYRVRSLDPDPCKLCNALKQQQMQKQLEDRSALKWLTLKVTMDKEPQAREWLLVPVPTELTLALASLIKEFTALEALQLEADFSLRPNNPPYNTGLLRERGGTKVFREAVKGRVSSTPLWLHLSDYSFCKPCCSNRAALEPFYPYWEWDQWAHHADGYTDFYGKLEPCARDALFCLELVACLPCIICPVIAVINWGCCSLSAESPGRSNGNFQILVKPTAVMPSEAPLPMEMHRQTEDVEGSQMRGSSF